MKKNAGFFLFVILIITYYLSSLPRLGVLPLFRQVNAFLRSIDISISYFVYRLAEYLPAQLAPARTLTEDFLVYARANPVILEFLLRKTAHVVLFFFITMTLFLFIRHFFLKPWMAVAITFVLGGVVAVMDEYHQSFVPNRSGNVVDVAIDMAGVTAAVLLIMFALFITRHYRN